MNSDIKTGATDKIIRQLEATKKEIEEFLQELNVENTTAEQRYHQLKEELKSSIKEMKELSSKMPEHEATSLVNTLSDIKQRLENPHQDTTSDITELIKGITGGLKQVANDLRTDASFGEIFEKIHHQLIRYWLKFEILKLRLVVSTLKVKYTGKDMQYHLNLKIQAILKFLRESKHNTEDKLKRARRMANKLSEVFH